MIDPLADLQCDFQSYDIKRVCAVYADNAGERWWVKAWFNGRDKGEDAHPISKKIASAAINGRIRKDKLLTRYYPKQMEYCRKAVEQTRQNILQIR